MGLEDHLRESSLLGKLASERQSHAVWKNRAKRLEARLAFVYKIATGMDPDGLPPAYQLEEIAKQAGHELPEIHNIKIADATMGPVDG